MKTRLLFALAFAAALPPVSAQEPVVAFVGVNVVPMDRERVLDNQTVIVKGARIAEIGPSARVAVPAGAVRVEGAGKYLVPGLSDMHGHLPQGDGTGTDVVSQFLKLYLANGVTTVRGMQGSPGNVVVREKVARGELIGPSIVASGPPLHVKAAPTPEAAVRAVEAQKAAGYDAIKVHEDLPPEAYDAIVATARRLGMQVGGHVTATVGLDRALAARQSSIEHLDGYLQAIVRKDSPVPADFGQVALGPVLNHMDESRISVLADATRKAGVWNTPTLTLFEIVVSTDSPDEFLKWPELQYVSENLRNTFAKQKAGTANIQAPREERQRYLQLRNRMVKALSDAGAGLLIGPDTPQLFLVPGFATHREIRSLVGAGLSPYAALRAATAGPAEYLGRLKDSGTIETGKRADLVLVDGNPLVSVASLQKIEGVMMAGRWHARADIERMLAELAALHRAK
jgi:imidazolonepropionase-like amidohydrolase